MADTGSTDFFGAAGNNIDAQKAATLQAVANGGSAAKQAYTDAQAQNQAAMGSAVKTAIAQAIAARAPAPNVAAATPAVSTPYAQANDTLGKLGADRSQFFQNAGTLQGNFFNDMKTAMPVVERMYQAKIAGINEKASQAAQDRALREQELQQRVDKGNKPQTPADIIRALGGDKMAADTIGNAAKSVPAPTPDANPVAGGYGPQPTIQQQADSNRVNALHTVGQQLGLAPESIDALIQVTTPKTAPPKTAAIRADSGYAQGLSDAAKLLAGQVQGTPAKNEVAAVNYLVGKGMSPDTAYVVVNDAARMIAGGANLP